MTTTIILTLISIGRYGNWSADILRNESKVTPLMNYDLNWSWLHQNPHILLYRVFVLVLTMWFYCVIRRAPEYHGYHKIRPISWLLVTCFTKISLLFFKLNESSPSLLIIEGLPSLPLGFYYQLPCSEHTCDRWENMRGFLSWSVSLLSQY